MNLKVVRDQAAFFMMRSRMCGGMRWIASATRPGIGVAIATRTHSVSEMTRPAMAVASSEMVIGVWYRWPCRLVPGERWTRKTWRYFYANAFPPSAWEDRDRTAQGLT